MKKNEKSFNAEEMVANNLSESLSLMIEDILKASKNGQKWICPYKILKSRNFVSGKGYKGINGAAIMLYNHFTGNKENNFITSKQAKEMKWTWTNEAVEKFEKIKELKNKIIKNGFDSLVENEKRDFFQKKQGVEIIFYNIKKCFYEEVNGKYYQVMLFFGKEPSKKEIKKETFEKYKMFDGKNKNFHTTCTTKYYTVYPCNLFNEYESDEIEFEKGEITEAETVLKDICESYMLREGIEKFYSAVPCYSPMADKIGMPDSKDFLSTTEEISTLIHECSHSTGHKNRLDRVSDEYAAEELTAELTSLLMMMEYQLDLASTTNSLAYLGGWLKKSKENKGDEEEVKKVLLLRSLTKAQKAVDYLLGTTTIDEESQSQEE